MLGIDVSADSPRDAADAIRDGTIEAIHDAAQAGFAESQAQVPRARGELKASGSLLRRRDGATFGYRAEHARYVEGGTAPHWPPIAPLKEWSRIVLGDEDAAYAVQRKIADKGTPAQPFVRPGFEVAVRELERRGVERIIRGKL